MLEILLKTFIDIFKLIQTSKHKVNMFLRKPSNEHAIFFFSSFKVQLNQGI